MKDIYCLKGMKILSRDTFCSRVNTCMHRGPFRFECKNNSTKLFHMFYFVNVYRYSCSLIALICIQFSLLTVHTTESTKYSLNEFRNCMGKPIFTFSMSLCFNDLTDPSRSHSILGCEGELVPGATLEILQPIGPFAGADGEVAPLLTVVL